MSEEILAEWTATDDEGDGGLPFVPPLASDNTPGLIHTIRPSGSRTWGMTDGAAEIGLATGNTPGLFGGIFDFDGAEFPSTKINGQTPIPVYAKRVKDIHGNVWPLSDLVGDPWQAATVASCILPDGTPLCLRLRTDCHGHTLIFELATDQYYSS